MIAERIPSKANARIKIMKRIVLRSDVGDQGKSRRRLSTCRSGQCRRRDDRTQIAMQLIGVRGRLIAQTKIQRESRQDFPIVLEIDSVVIRAKIATAVQTIN